MPPAVSGRRVKRVRETAEVRQVRWETWGSQEWPHRETSIAAAAPRSLLISEIGRDSAASLRARTVKHCMALCLANGANSCRLCVSSPGRDDPGERPSPLASKLCSRCLNTSLGLKALWEISALASWERCTWTEISQHTKGERGQEGVVALQPDERRFKLHQICGWTSSSQNAFRSYP